MGRKGWTKVEVPDGWVEILRGPRPPSAEGDSCGEQHRSPSRRSSSRSKQDCNIAAQWTAIASPDTRGESGCRTREDWPHQGINRLPWRRGSRGSPGTAEGVRECREPGQGTSSGDSDPSRRTIHREGEEEIRKGPTRKFGEPPRHCDRQSTRKQRTFRPSPMPRHKCCASEQ